MKNYLSTIEKIRSERTFPVTTGSGLKLPSTKNLPTKVNGLYWIYTQYSIHDIISCKPSSKNRAVNIATLAKQHQDLANIYSMNNYGFNLVYNGIGGGLRERIQVEFNGGAGTGSLGILQTSLNDLNKWQISYVILQNNKITPDLNLSYYEYATVLERTWRLEYGWPLLCRS